MNQHKFPLSDQAPFISILDRIRKETSKILKIPFEKYFTDHSIEGHSTRILGHLHGLTRDLKTPLNDEEAYILVAAAYLHDISLAHETDISFMELRKEHPKLSGNLIRTVGAGKQIKGVTFDFGLPQPSSDYSIFTEYIARVAEGHGGTTKDSYYDNVTLNNSEVRVRLISDLLAFADELDLHRSRVDMTSLARANIPLADVFHWWKHWFVIGVRVESPCTVWISYAFPEEMEKDHDFPDLVQSYVSLRLKGEYAKVESTLAPENIRLYLHKQRVDYTPLALPGAVMPQKEIVDLFRNAVISLDPGYTGKQTKLNPNDVSANIENATRFFMVGMLPEGVGEDLYVRRRDAEEAFEGFVERANEQLFLLAGRPGTGKTMFMRRMIAKYPSFSLFYSYSGHKGEINDLPKDIVDLYAATIAGKFQQKNYKSLNITMLEEMVKTKGKWVLIFIESNCTLDELSKPNGLLHNLLSKIKGRNTKICLSCIADVGETFQPPEGLGHMLYQPDSRMWIVAPSVVLKDYSEEEFRLACINYFAARKIKASSTDFVNEARDRLKNPMWLDIYSLARTGTKPGIEASIRFVEVCESFISNRSAKAAKLLGEIQFETLIQNCLNDITEMLISAPGATLESNSLMDIIQDVFSETPGVENTSIFEAIKMAGLIKERYVDSSDTGENKGYIKLAFEEIRDYLIARQSAIETLDWTSTIKGEDIKWGFFELLRNSKNTIVTPYTIGIFEFLVLLLEHTARNQKPIVLELQNINAALIDEILLGLADYELETGQQVCARALGRIVKHPNNLIVLVNKLIISRYENVRRDLTFSLSALSCKELQINEKMFDARDTLLKMIDDSNESVACCAVAALIKSLEDNTITTFWSERFMTVARLNRRPLTSTMVSELSRRSFPNTNEFFPDILKHLCLSDDSDYRTVAEVCDCLSNTGHLYAEEAFAITLDIIRKFRRALHGDVVIKKAIPALISMEPYLHDEVCQALKDFAILKGNEHLKIEIINNLRKLFPVTREDVIIILEDDESSLVRALVSAAKQIN